MKSLSLLFTLLSVPVILFAQSNVDYNDVAVIVNDNSTVSINIANYFKQQRSIPDQNIIHISCSTNETIDSLEFELIRQQIENYLLANNLVDSINYIVTTKGVPIKVERTNCYFAVQGSTTCASVESELTLILSTSSNLIGTSIPFISNYFSENAQFSRANYDMYLVTRLDGYTESDVLNLIDRSGPNTPVNLISSNFVFDLNNVVSGDSAYFASIMTPAIDMLQTKGWNTIFHPDTNRLYSQENVLGYSAVTYGSSFPPVNNQWVPASIAELINPGVYETFINTGTPSNPKLGDLISEGLTGGNGYLYPTFFSYLLDNLILFDRYTDTDAHYNLAESYYMATKALSWSNIVIGDPKTSIFVDNTASLSGINESGLTVGPNPSNGLITVYGHGFDVRMISVYNNIGELVYLDESQKNADIQLDLTFLHGGTYFLTIETTNGMFRQPIVLLK